MRSIRTRITLAVVGCTAIAVAIAALVVGWTGRKMLFDALDERLTSRARWFTVMPRWNEFAANFPFNTFPQSEAASGTEPGPANPAAAGVPAGGDGAPGGDRNPGDRPGRGSRDTRDGGGAAGAGSSRSSRDSARWHLVLDRADQTEISSDSDELPDGFSLALVGAKPGEKPISVSLDDGRVLRVYAFESSSVSPRMPWRGIGPGNPGGPPMPTPEDATTPTAPPSGTSPDGSRDHRRPAITYLASDATDTHAEANRLAGLLAAAWAAATALAFALSRGTARAVLAPVANLSKVIEKLSPQNLAARVPMEEVPAELSAVIARLNALLKRVESAFERERATIANMAHELRTPIAALRTELEFAQFRSDTRPQDQRTMEKSLALAMRMQSLVNGLLTMSRIESGQETLTQTEVDVARVVREAWSSIEARAGERGFAPRFTGCESFPISSSAPHLAMIAANLLDNSVSHGAPGEVEVTIDGGADPQAETVRILVANRCSESHSFPENLFEPFWRNDPARTGECHFGLGLALCARVVKLLGGTIVAEQDEGRFAVTVELPHAHRT